MPLAGPSAKAAPGYSWISCPITKETATDRWNCGRILFVTRRSKFLIVTSLLLLLAAGVDVLALDFLLPSWCTDGSDSGRDDDCFCCCRHVVPTALVTLEPLELLRETVVPLEVTIATVEGPAVYHPPKA